MKSILIELILTNQCNKRCEYCDLDFQNKIFFKEYLDIFSDFLKNNPANYKINFFGGEPLLQFEKLKYFVLNSKKYVKYFSVGTNGIFLNKEKLDFFLENNIKIYLSVDNISCGKSLDFEILKNYQKIISINFINDPDYLQNSLKIFEKIKQFGFENISFMPVFNTKKWSIEKLSELKKIVLFLKNNFENISYFSYFNGVSKEKQFILDTDLYFYSDLDSLLWLQKQYKNIDKNVKQEIEKFSKIKKLEKNLKLEDLEKNHKIEEMLKLIFSIPKKSGDILTYKIIDKILKK